MLKSAFRALPQVPTRRTSYDCYSATLWKPRPTDLGRQEIFSRAVSWLATLVKFSAEIGQQAGNLQSANISENHTALLCPRA